LINPDEIEINCTTEPDKFASYIDILLNIDSNDRLITTICDKRDDFDFSIVKGIVSKLMVKFWMCQKCGKMKDYNKKMRTNTVE
jgi:hypothetical protein